jgi:EmrB/QacA subfamily drug resistance transporter
VIRLSHTTARRLITTAVVLGSFMGAADASIVIMALPTLAAYFNVGTNEVLWVLISYLLVVTAFLIPFGRLGDLQGLKKIYIAGFALFTGSSLLCGIAPDLSALILCRALQGLGGAMIVSTGPAIISLAIPAHERGRAFGYLSAANGLGLAAGFGLGGIILPFLPWQWIFFINVPVGAAACVIAYLCIPQEKPHPVMQGLAFDCPGALLVMLTAGLFVYALSFGEELGWTNPVILAAGILSLVSCAAFVIYERRQPSPLIAFGLLKNPTIAFGLSAALVHRTVIAGMTFLLPLYFVLVQGYSTAFTGLLLFVPSLFIMVTGPVAGSLSDRNGSWWLCVLAGFLLLLSLVLFIVSCDTSALLLIIPALVLRAVATGLFVSPNMRSILAAVPREHRGAVSGIWYFVSYLASIIGIAVFEAIFDIWIQGDEPEGITGAIPLAHPAPAVITGFQFAFLAGMAFIFCLIVLTVFIREGKLHGNEEPAWSTVPESAAE